MKLIPILVAGLGIFSATHALSAAVTLDFEDQFSFSSVSYGPNAFGVAANGALLALANDGTGPGPSGEFFSNTPTGGAVVMFATAPLSGERAEITVANGFVDAVNFFYSSTAAATVYARRCGRCGARPGLAAGQQHLGHRALRHLEPGHPDVQRPGLLDRLRRHGRRGRHRRRDGQCRADFRPRPCCSRSARPHSDGPGRRKSKQA